MNRNYKFYKKSEIYLFILSNVARNKDNQRGRFFWPSSPTFTAIKAAIDRKRRSQANAMTPEISSVSPLIEVAVFHKYSNANEFFKISFSSSESEDEIVEEALSSNCSSTVKRCNSFSNFVTFSAQYRRHSARHKAFAAGPEAVASFSLSSSSEPEIESAKRFKSLRKNAFFFSSKT